MVGWRVSGWMEGWVVGGEGWGWRVSGRMEVGVAGMGVYNSPHHPGTYS